MPDGNSASKAHETIEELSIQQRAVARDIPDSASSILWFAAREEAEIAAWWSEKRDQDLRRFWRKEGNDILQGAVSSMVKKFKAMNWVLEGPESDDKLEPRPGTVEFHQPILAEAEFGKGWGHLLGKTLTDLMTQDKGAYWELMGEGPADGTILSPGVLGVAHLDSGMCQPTGDPVFPVLYRNPKDGKSHKLHASRVVHLVDLPAPDEALLDVGFCAVSRVLASSRILLKLAKYKNEKLSDLPEAGMLLLNNIRAAQFEDTQATYQRERRRMGQELWSNILTLFSLDPAQPISAQFLNFSNLPDAFDERQTTDIYVNIVALAFGVDAREFWPISTGSLGTATETEIQHQKAQGKGVGDVISTLERAINWKILPSTVSFRFDFSDDEEDRRSADISKTRTDTIMSMWKPPGANEIDLGAEPPVSRAEIRQMLADNVPYFSDDFLAIDVTEETQVTDTEREAGMGPRVAMDWKGVISPLGYKRQVQAGRVQRVLDVAEENYRQGLISLDDLVEFRLAEMMEKRMEKELA